MSDSNRSEFVALVAVACTFVVFLIGLGAGTHYNERQQHQTAQSNWPSLHLLEGSPISYQAICNAPENETQADLCQQWRAAEAATDSARWTQLQFWLGAAGFVGLIITVAYSVRAFRHTAAQAKAATDANVLASETAHRQLRPYVFFGGDPDDRQEPFETGNRVWFSFKNYGQTPARAVSIQVAWDIVSRPIGEHQVALVNPPEFYGDIGPGAPVIDSIRIGMSADQITMIVFGAVLLMRMKLTYGLGDGTTDSHDVTWRLIDRDVESGAFHLVSKEERERQA